MHSGPSRADCKCCSAVIHVRCIPKIVGECVATPHIGASTWNSDSTMIPGADCRMLAAEGQFRRVRESSITARMTDISRVSVQWVCLDCLEDIESKTHYELLRHRLRYRESREIFAVVKVQSFTRMVRYRLDYIFAKIGFTKLQQLFRAKKAW